MEKEQVDVESKIKDVISDYLGVDQSTLTPETTLEDLGADSLDVTELIMSFEEEFNIEIQDADMDDVKTIQQVVNVVKSKMAT